MVLREWRNRGALWFLDRNPRYFIDRNLILSPVVELRRSRALVVGDVLRGFKRALVLQVRGDAGRPEGHRFGLAPETESSRRLRERIEAARRRLVEARERGELSGPIYEDEEKEDLTGLSVTEILHRGRLSQPPSQHTCQLSTRSPSDTGFRSRRNLV